MVRVLLIEPDRVLAETYCQSLSGAGYEVVACGSAQAAILAADEQRPDVVIVELQLIEHSGIEFLYEFRSYADWQAIPIIVQSHVPPAEFSGNWQMLAQEFGIRAFLYKPQTSLRQLTETIKRQLAVSV